MSNVLLPAPHFKQSRDGTCLPVCMQMVLAHLGDARTEADFSKLLGTNNADLPKMIVQTITTIFPMVRGMGSGNGLPLRCQR